MVSAPSARSSDPCSSSGRKQCVLFSGETLNSHSASLRQGVNMGISNFNVRGNPAMG